MSDHKAGRKLSADARAKGTFARGSEIWETRQDKREYRNEGATSGRRRASIKRTRGRLKDACQQAGRDQKRPSMRLVEKRQKTAALEIAWMQVLGEFCEFRLDTGVFRISV